MNVLVSQRVDFFGSHNEKRDSLDIRWYDFFLKVGINPIIVPNNLELINENKIFLKANGLLLTGGNTLSHLLGGNAPERDDVEKYLLALALGNGLPIIGICRGFQMIQHYLGGNLLQVEGYAGNKHKVMMNGKEVREITTHCKFAFSETPLSIISVDENGIILSAHDQKRNIYGQLWHPEREINDSIEDVKQFKKVLGIL